jgi:hypothetical protein
VLPKEIVESDRRDDRYKKERTYQGHSIQPLYVPLPQRIPRSGNERRKKDFQLLTVQDRDLPPASHRWVPET